MANQKLSVHDPEFVNKIIFEVKSSGHFDAFRKECLSDVDVNPAYQNLHSRVEDSVQKFLNRQEYTPDTNKIRLREDMRMNITRAGFLDTGVGRIVDQIVEQKMDYIQSKVEEILYNYIGIEKPIKEEKKNNGALKVDTELMPNDLEQVSDKTSLDSMDMKEEIEEEVVDDDFESPAFEPIESTETKNENTQGSNLSEISGLTSQDSLGNKSAENEEEPPPPGEEEIILEPKREPELSQISTTTQDNHKEVEPQAIATALTITGISGEEAQMAPCLNDSTEIDSKLPKDVEMKNASEPQKSLFDLNKDVIEFTGTERKNITLDDSTNSGDTEKVLQPQDVQSNTMEIDNLYENDTTDSSEVKMEIDLKDESTQNTATSSKVEENSSQESLKEKSRKDHKSEKSRESHKSHKSSRHHHSSSSSKFKPDKSRSSHKSSSDKKTSSEKEKSSSSRKDREKDKKIESSRQKSKTETDDHQQEKSTRRRRSTDHDSGDGKDEAQKSSAKDSKNEPSKSAVDTKTANESNEKPSESPNKAKEQKSSILVKYDYLKSSPTKSTAQPPSKSDDVKNENDFHGFDNETKSPHNPWFVFMDLMISDQLPKAPNNNCFKKDTPARKLKAKAAKNNHEADADEPKIAPSQRYEANDLYKPKFDFRSRRRTQILDENNTSKETAPASN